MALDFHNARTNRVTPMVHAIDLGSPVQFNNKKRTRARAICGAVVVAPTIMARSWQPDHERACGECRQLVRRMLGDESQRKAEEGA